MDHRLGTLTPEATTLAALKRTAQLEGEAASQLWQDYRTTAQTLGTDSPSAQRILSRYRLQQTIADCTAGIAHEAMKATYAARTRQFFGSPA